MCSKAKAARKLQREEDEAIAAKREAEIQAKIRENVQLRAKRLAAAADAAGLDDNSPIYISDYGRSMTAGKLREWASEPQRLQRPCQACRGAGVLHGLPVGRHGSFDVGGPVHGYRSGGGRPLALVAGAAAGERPLLVHHGPYVPRW